MEEEKVIIELSPFLHKLQDIYGMSEEFLIGVPQILGWTLDQISRIQENIEWETLLDPLEKILVKYIKDFKEAKELINELLYKGEDIDEALDKRMSIIMANIKFDITSTLVDSLLLPSAKRIH